MEASQSEGNGDRRRLNTRTVAEAVAGELRARILDGDLVDGSVLPTEAELLKEVPASRPSLREALRILETEGLVTVRRGRRGGTAITHPTPETAAYHVGLLLHSRRTTLEDLAQARNLLEPLAADLAARSDDHEMIGEKLLALSSPTEKQLADGLAFTRLSADFHHELVMATGNHTLQLLVGILESIWDVQELAWAESAVRGGDYPDQALRQAVLKAHRRLGQAIAKGDHKEASRLARAHLEASSPFVATQGGHVRVLDDYGGPRQVRTMAPSREMGATN